MPDNKEQSGGRLHPKPVSDLDAVSESEAPSLIPEATEPPSVPTAPVVDPQQLAEAIERDQNTGAMAVCRTPKVHLTLNQMRSAIAVNPKHPVAIVFAKGIRGFPEDYSKTFHVEKPDLDALLNGKYVKRGFETVDGVRYEVKTLVDTPPPLPPAPSLLSSPVSQEAKPVEEEGKSGPVNIPFKPGVPEGDSKPVSIPVKKQPEGTSKPVPSKAPRAPEENPDHEVDEAIEATKPTEPKVWNDPEPIPQPAAATSKKKKTTKKKKS